MKNIALATGAAIAALVTIWAAVTYTATPKCAPVVEVVPFTDKTGATATFTCPDLEPQP